MGIEPTLRAWEAPVLPLNYTRNDVAAILIQINEPGQQTELIRYKNPGGSGFDD